MPPAAQGGMRAQVSSAQHSTMARRRTQWAHCQARWRRLQANRPLRELREIAKGVTKQLPEPIQVRLPCPHSKSSCRLCLLCLRNPAALSAGVA